MEQTPSIDVLVPHHRGRDQLEICLRSLEDQDYPAFRTTVLDNGSTDGSWEELSEGFPRVSLLRSEVNLGFGAAVNLGLRNTCGSLVAVLNDDCEADPTWLSELVSAMNREGQGVGFAASKMMRLDDPSRIDHAGDGIGRWGVPYGIGHLEVDRGQYDQVRYPLGACAGAAIYRRSLLDTLGGFDEEFFAYQEDMDLSLRAQMSGSRCVYVPTARVIHRGAGTTGSPFNPFTVYHSTRNLILLHAKNLPLSILLRWMPYLVLGHSIWFGKMAVKEGQFFPWLRGLGSGIRAWTRVRKKAAPGRRASVLSAEELRSLLRTSGAEIARSVRAKRGRRIDPTTPAPMNRGVWGGQS